MRCIIPIDLPRVLIALYNSGVVCQLGPEVDPEVWKVGDRAGLKPVFDVCHEW